MKEIILKRLWDTLMKDSRVRDRVQRGLAQTIARCSYETLVRQALGLAEWSEKRSADLSRVTIPTLVLAGSDDLLTPDGAQLAEAIPRARCETLPGCGHALAIDGAERVTELCLEHLEAH